MRITGGRLAGRQLLSPGGRVRPTAEVVRDRWLSSLEADLNGARVLELFAGTGALGLEALSRGAHSVDFVEWNPSALHALKGNVTAWLERPFSRILTVEHAAGAPMLEGGRGWTLAGSGITTWRSGTMNPQPRREPVRR
ncbi:MAG: RsmD family RNA methyltransferase [Gemmatimonadota bacterium]